MADVYVLLNHKLSGIQTKQLKERGVDRIVRPPESISAFWQGIPPTGPLPVPLLDKITNWLQNNAKSGDLVLVQGEFGATCFIVDYCFQNQLTPIYATSERKYREETQKDGSVVRIHRFSHVQFREYKRSIK